MTTISRYQIPLPGFLWSVMAGILGTLVFILEILLLGVVFCTPVQIRGALILAVLGVFLVLSAVFTYRLGFSKGRTEAIAVFSRDRRNPDGHNPYLRRTFSRTFIWILFFGLIGLTYRAFYQLGRYRAYWETWKAYKIQAIKRGPQQKKKALAQELARLAELHQQGSLSEEEFAQAKARLLA